MLDTACVKEEWVGASEPAWSGAALELYAGHEVKDELVLGPTTLQPPDAAFAPRAPTDRKPTKKTVSPPPPARGAQRRPDRKLHTCQYCMKGFAREKKLVEHVRIHTGEKPFSCDVCGRRFRRVGCLARHRESHAPDDAPKPFCCKTCDKQFVSKAKLRLHSRTHADRLFECDICSKRFPTSYKLNIHKTVHSPGKRHACGACGRRFSSEEYLRRHARSLHGEDGYLFSCKFCSKKFSLKYNLDEHLPQHANDNQYTCDICMAQFRTKVGVTLHIRRRHTRVKPANQVYTCAVCMKGFASKYYWSNHRRVHSLDKPYVCAICSKRFKFKSNLYQHEKTHLIVKPFYCDCCMKGFATRANLTKHIIKQMGTLERPRR